MGERRDHQRRAELFSRVVAWLRRQRAPASIPADIADGAVARRILIRLAVRGLARHVKGGWLPGAALGSAAELRPDGMAA